ncbi:MAG: nucleotidyltransferase [Bacteroidota bacterium]
MAKTLEQGFDTFFSWIAPLSTEQDKAKSHKDSVKSCLEKNFACYEFPEIGSFGNGTGVRHYSDTDYLAVCPTDKLTKLSSTTLRKVKEALQETFWQTKGIEVNTPSVRIPFGQYASENMEVTPCDFVGLVETPVGKKASYDIPDYDDGWMQSSPAAHNAYVKREDERLGGKLKPLIRLIKAWRYYNNVPVNSFYLELRTTKYSESEKSILYDIDIKNVLKQLNDNQIASIQDPMGISGYVRACSTEPKKEEALSKLATGLSRAQKAVDKRESDLDKAFEWWNLFFNGQFPSR